MRLSATERIIREAEDQDVTAAPADGRGAGAAPPIFDVDLGGVDDADQEGATLVDTERVALALKELRSYGVPPSRAPTDVPAPGASKPTFWRTPNGLARAPESPIPRAPNGHSPGITAPTAPRTGTVPPGTPGAGTSGRATAVAAQPFAAPQPPRIPAAPALAASQPTKERRLSAPGRGPRILIACLAAAAALAVGAWTGTRSASAVRRVAASGGADSNSLLSANRSKVALRAAVSPVIEQVPAAPVAPPQPSAVTGDQAPPASPAAPDLGQVAAGSGIAGASSSPPPVPGATVSVTLRRGQVPAAMAKSRAVRKKPANNTGRGKAPKVAAARARSSREVTPGNQPKGRGPQARLPGADPDATLPITD